MKEYCLYIGLFLIGYGTIMTFDTNHYENLYHESHKEVMREIDLRMQDNDDNYKLTMGYLRIISDYQYKIDSLLKIVKLKTIE